MASKSIEWRVDDEPRVALSAFRAAEGPAIEKRGYKIDDQSPESLTYKRKMTIPPERFTVTAEPVDGGTLITVEGKVHRKLRKSFATLAEQSPATPEPDVEEFETAEEVEEVETEPEVAEDETEPEVEEVEIGPPVEEPVVGLAPAQLNGAGPEPASPEAEGSPMLREVRSSPLMAEGASRRLDAEAKGGDIDCSEMRTELESIYGLAGHPEAFQEARGKVAALAEELVLHAGSAPDEALYIAYRRSLDEHREFLVAKGISHTPAR